jgi:RecA-family ATPase
MSLLAEGLFILAGRPKLGKSWLVLNFAVAIASGGYALGTIKVDAGDVLFCALEDGARRLQQRLRKSLGRGSVPENLYLATDWRAFDRGGLKDLESWLQAHPNARFVVFDTLERVRPSEDPRARLYHSDYESVKGLQDLAKRYRVCFLVVHHTRKADSRDHLDS